MSVLKKETLAALEALKVQRNEARAEWEVADKESAATAKSLYARVKAIEKYLGLAKGENKK